MSSALHHLYAIVERLPRRWRPPAAAVGGVPVAVRTEGALAVVASALEATPAATPHALAAHHDVIRSTLAASAVLPLPFGLGLLADDLQPWLARNGPALAPALAAVRGRVEMSVKLLRLGPAAGDPGALGLLVERLVERAGLPDWRCQASDRPGQGAVAVAFLVPRADVSLFLTRIAPVASRATGVAVVPTGPGPAYSFVPGLDRLPPARVAVLAGRAPARGHADAGWLAGVRAVG